MTLKVMLEAEGHTIVDGDQGSSLVITDNLHWAVECVSSEYNILVLCRADQISAAVQTMRQGVLGYIFLPFQPGEAGLMVQRALNQQADGASSSPPEIVPVQTLEAVESAHIVEALRRCNNNQAKTARLLGIGRNTLWRKLKKLEAMQKMAHPGNPHE